MSTAVVKYVLASPRPSSSANPAQLRKSDLDTFDYIFAMDLSNLSDIRRLARTKQGHKAKVMLWGEYAGEGRSSEAVDDPYYGGERGFKKAFEQCMRFTTNFLTEVAPGANGGSA